jgi:hypothetical protein
MKIYVNIQQHIQTCANQKVISSVKDPVLGGEQVPSTFSALQVRSSDKI